MKELEIANKLEVKIKELDNFLYTVTEYDEKSTAIPSVSVIMKKEVHTKISLLGYRSFGTGSFTQDIIIPDEIRNELLKIAKRRKRQLQKELESIFNK